MRNRIQGFFRSANRPPGNDGAALMAKGGSTTKEAAPLGAPSHGVEAVSAQFGSELRAKCETLGITREQFFAKARSRFRKLKSDVTPERWYKGETLPRKMFRGWFSEEFGIEVPNTRTGNVKVRSRPSRLAASADYMAYAVGSLQTAIQSSDDQIVHEVKDSLKDPAQNPWMRIAVTLIRQAHRQS